MNSIATRWPTAAIKAHALEAALIGVFGLLFIQFIAKMNHTEHGSRSAFLRWRTQLQELDDGVNVWEKYAYPNPPIMVLILKPFMQLPPMLGATTWFACKTLMALAAILAVLYLLDRPEHPFPLWGKVFAVALTLRPVEGDLVHGNVNLWILFLIAATLYTHVHRRDWLAGMLLALSIACKLTPALFLLYFLWKRAWTTLIAAMVGLVMFVLVLPAFVFGWDENVTYLQTWNQQMVAPYAAGVVTSEHKNQSLPGLLHRMLSDAPSFSDFDGDRRITLETHNVVSWDGRVVQRIVLIAMGLFACVVMRFCPPNDSREAWRTTAEFAAIALGMLLFCERTWKHHCVTLLLPFAVLCLSVSSFPLSKPLRWYIGITLILVAILMLSTSTGAFDQSSDPSSRFGKLAQVYGAYVWAFLLLLIAVFTLLAKTIDSPKTRNPDAAPVQ